MTSEGQYAGSQPAEATSGGPLSDGFPPDSDGQRISGRASAQPPADGFPSSYAPPPASTPHGGSPFVVPAVRTFGNGSEAAAGRPAAQAGTPYGSARPARPEEGNGALPQRSAASPYGSVSPGTASPFAPPPRSESPFAPPRAESPFGPPPGAASPFAPSAGDTPAPAARSPFDRAADLGSFDRAAASGPSSVPASGNAPEAPRSAWAPQPAPTRADSGDSAFPLPQRTPSPVDPATIGEFDGFAAGTPGRGIVDDPPPSPEVDPPTSRPPGLSAFGDQRVRVPGATLTDLPDAPTPGRPPRASDSGGFPTRTPGEDPGAASRPPEGGFPLRSGGATFPTRRGDSGSGSGGFPLRGAADPSSGGFPLRGPAADAKPEAPGQPVGDLPIRSQQAPFGPPPAAPPAATSPFSAFGPPPAQEEQPHPYGEPPAGPFGRRPGADAAEPPARGGLPDPFGRTGPDDQPFGGPAASPFGTEPPAPYGTDSGASAAPPFGSARPASPAASYGSDAAAPAAPVYGSPRPASPAASYGSEPAASYGSEPAASYGSEPAASYGSEPAASYGSEPAASYGSEPAASYGSEPAASYGSEPAGSYGTDPEPGPPFFGSAASDEPSGSARPASPAVYGSARPAYDDNDAQPGRGDSPLYGSARPASPAFGDGPAGGDEHAMYRRPESPADSGSGGYPQRVPGAALGAPLVAENRNGPVPQPRDPAEHTGPAVGSARPVTASASVPSASRVAPVDPGELPPPTAAPQARVYGRPAAPAEPEDDEPPDAGDVSPFGEPTDNDRSPFGPSGFGPVAYGSRPNDHDGPGGNIAQGEPGIAPQSPARATARASASARVAPPAPPDQPRSGPPFADLTGPAPDQPRNAPSFADLTRPAPDFAGPPAGGGYPPEQYSELTTDIAGREQQPYVPAPALPHLPPMNAGSPDYPGAGSRATVTPPSPDDTTNWPGPAGQNRFDAFKPDVPAKPETPHVRMLPILITVVVGAVLLLGVVFGIVYLVAGGDDKTFTVNTGECVKRDGDAAVKADCGDASSFQVVSIVDDKSKCADPNQPYVVNPTSDGKNQVLCLKPQG